MNQPKIRVLVVDDSALMRKLITQILNEAPDFEVVGTARDGEDGLNKVRELRPDVVTLDVEMPHLDGLGFLEAQMQEHPLPVVMVSSLTQEGADTTLACLQRGAVDCVGKPSGSISLNIHDSAEEIITRVRAAAGAKVRAVSAPALRLLPAQQPPVPKWPAASTGQSDTDADFRLVVIASSTGGPAALQEFLPRLRPDWNAAYLLVQHLPPNFTRMFAERMNSQCALTVREAAAGDRPERGTVLLAPGGKHLELDANRNLTFSNAPSLWGVRPAADVLMHTAAARFGTRTIGIVLTGMGRDGALGAKAIREAGGYCLGQDEATCVVYGMPRAALEAGGIDRIVPLPQMGDTLMQIITEQSGRIRRERKAS